MTIQTSDAFLGVWELDPTRNQYEFGPPPGNGTYTITTEGTAYYFDIKWTDADGIPQHIQFDGVPDGRVRAYEGIPGITGVSHTRKDNRTLVSETFSDDKRVAYASRTLDSTGTQMTVIQQGTASDGTTFSNQSLYQRRTNQ